MPARVFQFLFVDADGCTYDFPVHARSRRDALAIWKRYFSLSYTVYLRIVEV